MTVLDIIILAILCFFAAKGLVRGLVNEASSLAGLLAGVWLAYHYYPVVAIPVKNHLHLPAHLSAFLAFIVILLLTGFLTHIIGNLITAALRLVMMGSLNRLGGLLLGTTEGMLLLSLMFSVSTSSFMPERVRSSIHASRSASLLASMGDTLLSQWRRKPVLKP